VIRNSPFRHFQPGVDTRLAKQWMVMEALLDRAIRYLCDAAPHLRTEGVTELAMFEEYLQHNDFGRALGELASLGKNYPCKGAFWRSLERAAIVMELEAEASQYRKAFLSTVAAAARR
jgi:hypothetical protein